MTEEEGEPYVTRRAALYALVAILGGSGGSIVMDILKDPRPDPYTGKDGLRDKVEIMKRLDRKRDRIERMQDDLHELELHHQGLENEVHHMREMMARFQRHMDAQSHRPKPH